MSEIKTKFEDLRVFITEEFEKNNHPTPEAWCQYLSEYVCDEMLEKTQITYINNELRLMFVKIEGDTSDQRFCITDHVTVAEWKKLLAVNVIPFLSKKARLNE